MGGDHTLGGRLPLSTLQTAYLATPTHRGRGGEDPTIGECAQVKPNEKNKCRTKTKWVASVPETFGCIHTVGKRSISALGQKCMLPVAATSFGPKSDIFLGTNLFPRVLMYFTSSAEQRHVAKSWTVKNSNKHTNKKHTQSALHWVTVTSHQ